MTQNANTRISTAPAAGAPGTSGWVGWIAFSAVMLAFLGTIQIFEGIVALLNDEYFKVGRSGLLMHVDLTAWGWMHVVIGLVLVGAAVGIFGGQIWARVVGVLAATLSVLSHVLFFAADPVWSMIMIAICVIVIMALTVHGSEIRAGNPD